jgi:hypothetical protein
MFIDHTAVLSCFVRIVTVVLFSQPESCVISGLRRGVNEICIILGYLRSAEIPTFRDNLSVPSSRIKQAILDRKERGSQSESSFK